jgi:hypothetical protein
MRLRTWNNCCLGDERGEHRNLGPQGAADGAISSRQRWKQRKRKPGFLIAALFRTSSISTKGEKVKTEIGPV